MNRLLLQPLPYGVIEAAGLNQPHYRRTLLNLAYDFRLFEAVVFKAIEHRLQRGRCTRDEQSAGCLRIGQQRLVLLGKLIGKHYSAIETIPISRRRTRDKALPGKITGIL